MKSEYLVARSIDDAVALACDAVGISTPSRWAPGRWVRCDVLDAGRSGRGDGAVMVAPGLGSATAYNWHTWHYQFVIVGDDDRRPDPATRRAWADAAAAARREADAEAERRHQRAAQTAASVWAAARDDAANHPYIISKGLSEHVKGVRTISLDDFIGIAGYRPHAGGDPLAGPLLVAPVIAADGSVRTLELIAPDGRKAALAGGKRKGHFWAPDEAWRTAGTVVIAEGVATALSALAALDGIDATVIAALSAGNLEAAARALLEARGDRRPRIVIAADLGDEGTPCAPACAAAEALGAALAAPPPPEGRDARGWDIDDLRRDRGLAAVRQAIEAALTPRATEGLFMFRPVPIVDELDAPPPPFLVERWIPEGEVTLLAAHGGTGKSLLALALAAHVAAGRAFCGLSVQRRRVALISLEDDDRVLRHRLGSVLAAYGMTPREVRDGLQVLDASEAGPLATELYDNGARSLVPCKAWTEMERINADFIIIDGASDAFDANENDRRLVRSFITMLRTLARRRGGAVLLLAHLPKDSRYGYSGSTAWHNSARSRLSMTRDDSGVITVSHDKSNHGLCADDKRLIFVDGALVPAEPGEVPAHAPGRSPSVLDASVLDAIRAAHAAGSPIPAGERGPGNAPAALGALLRGQGFTARRAEIEAALIRLAAAGQIARGEVVTPQRKRREVWVPASAAAAAVAPVSPPITPPGETRATGAGFPGLRGFLESAQPAQPAQPAHVSAPRPRGDWGDGDDGEIVV